VPTRHNGGPSPRPVFLVAAARSGSTLLRHILDAHVEVGCPGETGLAGTIGALGRAWYTVASDRIGGHAASPPPQARASIRRAVTDVMAFYCAEGGKRVYCDKSLETPHWLGGVHAVMPEARYILMYRHVLDVVMSGLGASLWGFNAYGYAPYVSRSVENFVAPLVQHWNVHVEPTLEWHSAHPDLCYRVRYEDLVAEPAETLGGLCAFLNVDYDGDLVSRALATPKTSNTPGDHKVLFTRRLHDDSVGSGRRVPIELIPPPLLEEVNVKLGLLGYSAIGTEPAALSELSAVVSTHDKLGLAARLQAVMPAQVSLPGPPFGCEQCILRVDGDPTVEWHVDLASGAVRRAAHSGPIGSRFVLTGDCEDLVALVEAEVNGGELLAARRIRAVNQPVDGSLVRIATALADARHRNAGR
jgi:protein-tyrosine sulfotransferase